MYSFLVNLGLNFFFIFVPLNHWRISWFLVWEMKNIIRHFSDFTKQICFLFFVEPAVVGD